jgi:hypothetical protein
VDPTSTAVQPEGQGGATGDTPYREYLDRIPEELRDQVEPVFKDWDSSVTKRFMDASQYRKQWEPYEQVGLNQYDPQDLAGLLEFSKMAGDPAQYRSWLQEQAQQMGLLGEPEPEFDDSLIDPSVSQLLERQMNPVRQELDQLREWKSQFEQQQEQQAIRSQMDREIESLSKEHGEIDSDMLAAFASRYLEQGPQQAIRSAFDDMQKWRGSIEQSLLRGKLNQPGMGETGSPDSSVEAPKTLQEAQKAMVERLNARQSM